MVCLSTVFMGLVLLGLFIANIWHRETQRAIITLIVGTVLLTIQALACQKAGEIAGWIALGVVIGFVFLAVYYDSKPRNNLTKCPGPDPCPPPPIDPCSCDMPPCTPC